MGRPRTRELGAGPAMVVEDAARSPAKAPLAGGGEEAAATVPTGSIPRTQGAARPEGPPEAAAIVTSVPLEEWGDPRPEATWPTAPAGGGPGELTAGTTSEARGTTEHPSRLGADGGWCGTSWTEEAGTGGAVAARLRPFVEGPARSETFPQTPGGYGKEYVWADPPSSTSSRRGGCVE